MPINARSLHKFGTPEAAAHVVAQLNARARGIKAPPPCYMTSTGSFSAMIPVWSHLLGDEWYATLEEPRVHWWARYYLPPNTTKMVYAMYFAPHGNGLFVDGARSKKLYRRGGRGKVIVYQNQFLQRLQSGELSAEKTFGADEALHREFIDFARPGKVMTFYLHILDVRNKSGLPTKVLRATFREWRDIDFHYPDPTPRPPRPLSRGELDREIEETERKLAELKAQRESAI